MSEYVTLEEAAKARGESRDTIAWLMTTKDCKIYLRFDESQESSIAISTYEGLPNHHSLYVIERGYYPLALEAQNKLYQRLVEGNFDIDHLDFTDEKNKIRAFLVRGNLNVSVVVKKDDLKRLSPPSTYQTAPGSMYPAPPEKKISENFEWKNFSKRKGEKEEHTLVFLEALKDCDEKLKKESTSNDIWKHLKEHLRSKYDPDENIISTMHLNEMLIIKSSGNDESLEKESFARAIRRLRKDTHS